NSKKEAAALIDLVENNYRGYIKIYGERSSSKFYALKYGTSTNFTEPKLVKRIAEIYPDEKIYFWGLKLGERYFENWTNRIPLSDIVRQSNDVIIQGNLDNLTPENLREIETRNNVKLMKIFQGSKEAVYLITE
ncbi:MAG TPA: hypothetical protein VNJ07_00105, partial [Chitinophagales bacterium]|nr:hypothetical protein [Chitinophagales bacterium]